MECLAIITFVGGNDQEETERSMDMMWRMIHPKLGSNVGIFVFKKNKINYGYVVAFLVSKNLIVGLICMCNMFVIIIYLCSELTI